MISAMKRHRGRLALAAFVFLLCASCSAKVPNLDSAGRTIVCFGDSITAGYGAEPAESYPSRLAERLGREVVNAGVPGDTTEDGLARVDDVLAQDPWLVIVEFGGNDLLRRAPIETTEANLDAILRRLLAAHVVPVLVETRAPYLGSRYRDLFERLADRHGVPLVDDVIADILADPAKKSDEIHPNAIGYQELADQIGEAIEPILAAHEKRTGR